MKKVIMICVGLLFCLAAPVFARQNPNVVFFLADDMGYGDIAANGNPILKTPNYDKLHEQSVRFTNYIVSPSCGPSRAAFMTGKHEFLSGNVHTLKGFREMSLKSTTVAELFKAAGYQTGIFGKWHLGLEGPYNPGKRGFIEAVNVKGDDQKKSHFNPILMINGREEKHKGYRTDVLFNLAMDFITRHKDEPFFLYLPTYSPHLPHKCPRKYENPYNKYKDQMAKDGKKFQTGFVGQVINLDYNLGRLMAHLDELGLSENTLLIAMTDNGSTSGTDTFNGGRRGVKGTIWSGGTRAYSYWRMGTRFKPGERHQMAGNVDFLPTMADLCGLRIPNALAKEIEGTSLLPLLKDANDRLANPDRMLVHAVGRWENPKNWRAHKYSKVSVTWKNYTLVRTDRCGVKKCTRCWNIDAVQTGEKKPSYTYNKEHHAALPQGKWALFDLEADPFESRDIAAAHPEIVRRMSAHYEAWWDKAAVYLSERYGE